VSSLSRSYQIWVGSIFVDPRPALIFDDGLPLYYYIARELSVQVPFYYTEALELAWLNW
jgi:hypothetical protein